jgi:hypothetical protein
MAPVLGLRTLRAGVLDGFVEFVVRIDDALLTVVTRAYQRRTTKRMDPTNSAGANTELTLGILCAPLVGCEILVPTLDWMRPCLY